MAAINLCSLPFLSNDYQNVIDFSSINSQVSYFLSKRILPAFEGNIISDGEREIITTSKTLSEIRNADYLIYTGEDNKNYFYFITNKIMKTKASTTLVIELDVFQTYLFDYTILDSYIDRCHVDRWRDYNGETVPTSEVIDEGLPVGEYIIKEYEDIYNHEKNYVMVTTSPIGVMRGGGAVSYGLPSKLGFRFIKGYEGFGAYPYTVLGETARTYGYGIREDFNTTNFNKMLPSPCTEALASEVFGDLLTDNYSDKVWNEMLKYRTKEEIKLRHFDAFSSLCYNCGFYGFTSSPMFQKWIVNPNEPSIYDNWLEYYIKGEDGSILPGLVARRLAEANIYKEGVYEMRGIAKIGLDGSIIGIVTDNNGDGYIPSKFI